MFLRHSLFLRKSEEEQKETLGTKRNMGQRSVKPNFLRNKIEFETEVRLTAFKNKIEDNIIIIKVIIICFIYIQTGQNHFKTIVSSRLNKHLSWLNLLVRYKTRKKKRNKHIDFLRNWSLSW